MALKWNKVGGGENAEAWNYREDKNITGKLVQRKTGVGPNNSNMYMLEQKDGKLVGVWGSTLLNDRFSQVSIGNYVKIEYLGKEQSPKTGRSYHNFEFYVAPDPDVNSPVETSGDEGDFDDQDVPF
jgi:hypothetical protein